MKSRGYDKVGGHASAARTALEMSKVLFQFGEIKRATKMPNGEYESDSHHSFTLALIAYELAKTYAPELDAMKVIAYSLAHDLPEVVTSDVNTLLASSEELMRKKMDEKAALPQIRKAFAQAPNVLRLIEDYETCEDEEAKFVFWLDKTMAILTHFFDNGENLRKLGVKDQSAIEQWYERLQHKLTTHAAHPHPAASGVLESLYQKMHDELLPPASLAEAEPAAD